MFVLAFPADDPAAPALYLGGSLGWPRRVVKEREACHFTDADQAGRFWETLRASWPDTTAAWGEPGAVPARREREGAT